MTRAAVAWSDSGALKCVGLSETADNIVSRSADARVVLSDQTVSRSPHAAFSCASGQFLVEQLKTGVMPTLLNDVAIAGPVQLSDGDVVQVGSTRLSFHDLSAHDKRAARVQCGFCSAENDDRRSECWRCGENLANARSAVYEISPVQCRVVPSVGDTADLYRDDMFLLSPQSGERVAHRNSGTGQPADGAAVVAAVEGGSYLRLGAGAAPWLVNGQPAQDGRQLKTGDTLGSGEDLTLVIVR
jgi:hypothetical protein